MLNEILLHTIRTACPESSGNDFEHDCNPTGSGDLNDDALTCCVILAKLAPLRPHLLPCHLRVEEMVSNNLPSFHSARF